MAACIFQYVLVNLPWIVESGSSGLIMTRNRLAAHKARGAWALPPPLKNQHSCRSCMALRLCAVAHRAVEGGTGESFGLPEQFTQLTEHLTEQGAEFFRHWTHLLEMEQAEDRVPQSNIWAVDPPPHAVVFSRGVKRPHTSIANADGGDEPENMSPNSQRTSQHGEGQQDADKEPIQSVQYGETELNISQDNERQHPLVGRCIGSLIKYSFDGDSSELSLYPFSYTFVQKKSAGVRHVDAGQESLPLSSRGFAVGDCGILSVQDRHVAVNRARVLSVTSTELKLALRNRLPAALDTLSGASTCQQGTSCCSHDGVVWRLDKDESETAFQCAVAGVIELMVTQTAHAERMRGLIVHHNAPRRSAKENYGNEVPPEEDCFQAMLESECASPTFFCQTVAMTG